MSDLPPDAARLRTLRTYLALQLEEVDRAIAASERQKAPWVPPPAAPAAKEPHRAPAPPAWGLARIGLGGPEAVHRGDCWAEGGEMRPLTREDAAAHLAAGTPGCDVCRPERVLLRRD
ncbi:DUF6233 domain-containing protein [Streptomyces sp. AM 2-1-1]|uniref:DUF6233 domain-containing protein n=1 Tax=Streptomyces sp. AM 2-1-1 TaxID=3028709 RepID=UPI0023B90E51|nr:DUF6233 domain-containing protein [Streptomyces sp. AM 2-1-1]WEH40814.1 DUF6233 domain-containing protein [Streptomyces sp. AM 2-1-1]